MIDFDRMIGLTGSGLIPYLKGPRGEGKTTYVKDLSTYTGLGLRIMNLSTTESTDMCGLPYIEGGITKYAKPDFLEYDILFFDEVDRIRDSSVKAGLLSLMIDRSINGHKLKEDCMIFTAGNGESTGTMEYDTVPFDEAMKDRLIEIDFVYTVDQKISYYKKKYPNNSFVKFLEVKPEVMKTLSGRRIEAFLKVDSSHAALLLGKEIEKLWRHFIEANLVTLAHLKSNSYDFARLSPITKNSLVIDVVNGFYDINGADECLHINTFINKLRPEEKSSYFSRLKKLCMESPEKFNKKSLELNGLGLFNSQKEFLTELTK